MTGNEHMTQRMSKSTRVVLSALCIVAALVIILWSSHARPDDPLPSEKQAIEDEYARVRAEGEQNPAPRLGDASRPPEEPRKRYATGIFNGEDFEGGIVPSTSALTSNGWAEYDSADNYIRVYAGKVTGENQGVLIIFLTPPTGLGTMEYVRTPTQSGSVMITTSRNLELGLLSTEGTTYVFNIASSTFTKTTAMPDDTPPTCIHTGVSVNENGQTVLTTEFKDTVSGFGEIIPATLGNATISNPQYTLGTNQPVTVYTTRTNQHALAKIALTAIDVAGNKVSCTPVILPVIDIKPGSASNPINPKSNGTTTVAIFSTGEFHAVSELDQKSLTFGKTGNEKSLGFCNTKGEDVNGDGRLDLVCHFRTRLTSFQVGATAGFLKGKTTGGALVVGTDAVEIVASGL